jgi:hypothetical protein
LLQVEELFSHMRPTRRLLYAALFVDAVESGVGIGLQRAAKLAQMFFGMLSLAIRRVGKPCRGRSLAATRIVPVPAVCSSVKNANASIAATRLVRVTHPFHPLSGQQLACVGERYNRYGMTLLLQIDKESVCSVPPQWTDVVAPDPEIVMGGQQALFRVADLLELVRLVDRLSGRNLPES